MFVSHADPDFYAKNRAGGLSSSEGLIKRVRDGRGDNPDEVLQLMAHRLSAKFMHGPLQALHRAPEAEREALLKWLPQLFNIKIPNSK